MQEKLLDNLHGKEPEQCVNILTIYLNQIGKIPRLTQEEERHYAVLARMGDKVARDKLITSNLKLVVNLSKIYKARGYDIRDCIEEGNIGLFKAIDKFNPESGCRFSTYAAYWVREAIEHSFSNNDRNVLLPYNIVSKINKIIKKNDELTKKLHKRPTLEQISQCLGENQNEIAALINISLNGPSLDELVEGLVATRSAMMMHTSQRNKRLGSMDITYRTLLDIVQSDDPSPESQEIKFEERQNVYALLNSLSPLQRKVLMMRYGLNENQEENIFAEIGRQNGVSRENIRLLHNKAIQNIRKFIKERNIKKEDI